jgi:hypothetical protein
MQKTAAKRQKLSSWTDPLDWVEMSVHHLHGHDIMATVSSYTYPRALWVTSKEAGMAPEPTYGTVRRPVLITILAVIAALAVLKDLIDLVGKPADILLPNHDVQVWFGYRFEGWLAKLLTLPHLIIYGYAAYGLWRLTSLGWWVAFLYLLYMPITILLYLLFYAAGEAWEIIFAGMSLLLIAVIAVYLYTHRQLFGYKRRSSPTPSDC